jgi:DNA-binding NtrC family response regulator
MPATKTKTLRKKQPDDGAVRRSLRVEVLAGPDAGLSVTVGARAIVGRAETADVRLSDATVSQFHVELTGDTPGIAVRDLGSSNGTFAREVLLREAFVPPDAELELGETRLRVRVADAYVSERSTSTGFGELVGVSAAMRELFAMLERVSRSDLAVFIEGEAGTGKETVARALAAAGPRAHQPLHVVDCAALPRHLAEGALLGPGGALDAAAGGSLLLEDVSELPLDVQSLLARATAAPRPGGAPRLLGTGRGDLRALVNRGAFHEGLYFAIAQAHLRVPSLAERRDDLKPLVQHFLAKIPWETPAARAIEPNALEAIVGREFPGNVRELRAFVERIAKIADGATIKIADVEFARLLSVDRRREGAGDEPLEAFKEAKRSVVDEFERAYLTKLLARAGTNISRAAALAGVERQSLRSLLRRHGLRGDE